MDLEGKRHEQHGIQRQGCPRHGASSGIGAATASLLAERGAAVAVFGLRKDKLDDVVARIREAGGSGLAVPGDVGVPSDVERAVAAAVAEFGALHYGVNNAGMSGYFETVADLSLEKWNEVVTVNLRVPALRRPSYITGAHLAVDGGFLA